MLAPLLVLIFLAFFFSDVLLYGYTYGLTSYVYIGKSSGPPSYYILRAEVVNATEELVKVVNSENLTPIQEDDVMTRLLDRLRASPEGKQLAESVRESVKTQYQSEFKSELKQKIQEEYSHELFRQREQSFELLQELKADYLREHAEEIKEAIIADYLTDITDDSVKAVSTRINNKINRSHYFQFLFNDFIFASAPKTGPIGTTGKEIGGNMYREALNPGYTKKFLTKQRVRLTDDVFAALQGSHDRLVRSLKLLDDPPREIFSGNGIVINGGGAYMAGAMVTIVQLRELGSKLPIELILNTEDEYDKEICEEVLPHFNCTCKVIERELGSDLYRGLGLEKFQLKTVGLLISSYDNVIALDADNMPIKNPDALLTSEPFLSSKFVLWPDIWHKGTSPLYYKLARFNIGEPIHREGADNSKSFADYVSGDKDTKVLFHDLEGTPPAMGAETGQMVLSKRSHIRSLILALYYNVYGKSHYYPLLYQGTFGSGDRETFIPALHVMNEPYYLNHYQVWFAGYEKQETNSEGDTRTFLEESTMVQHDPEQTIKFFKDWEQWLLDQGKDTRLWPFQDNDFSRTMFDDFLKKKAQDNEGKPYKLPDALFLHVHKPKINPILNAQKVKQGELPSDFYVRRYLGQPGFYSQQFGSSTDWELKFNSIAKWVVCEGIKSKKYWQEIIKSKQKTICGDITKFVEFLKADTNDIDSAKLRTTIFD